MRLTILPLLIVFQTTLSMAQTSLEAMNLEKGLYPVGFRHYTMADSTRTYSRIFDYTNEKIARPIPVSIWYPSIDIKESGGHFSVMDYMEVLKEEEEWEYLPNEQILNWFYYANTPENQRHLNEITWAHSEAGFANGKFPLVVYAPSYQASSIENFALCEFLASHGFVVISSPSRGTETRWFGNNNAKEMETQARDMEFLMKEVLGLPFVDPGKIALMGFSFGGLSNIIVQNRNDHVKAISSLDGTERYQYKLLSQSPFFDPQKMDVPYLHMAQKEIPEIVLEEDAIDAELNSIFQLYDSISNSQAYQLKFHNLTHSYFSTVGVLFATRDDRQDKSDVEIMKSYALVCRYTLDFMKAFLHSDHEALKVINTQPVDSGIDHHLISAKYKQPIGDSFTFQDFNELVSIQNYENLLHTYQQIIKEHPSFSIPEGNLNTLGLQLIFNPKTSLQGIQVFLLATELYPNSANLFDSLGEGYLFVDDKEKAIESFEKSLELNAQNQNAIDRLKELHK